MMQQQRKESIVSICPGGFVLYELSARPWLYELSAKYQKPISKLSDIPDEEFLALKRRGVDMIWLMGVWELGAWGLKYDRTNPSLLQGYTHNLLDFTDADVIGSPYAIKSYKVNPQLGSDDDLRDLHSKLNSMGLLLMLDFVPNHTAVDCEWTISHPEYFVRAPKDEKHPNADFYHQNGIAYGTSGYGAWADTAQLNYWEPDLARERQKELLHVASFCDGVRCDMAYLLLNDLINQNWGHQMWTWGYQRPHREWWEEAIKIVKRNYPNFVFLAEVYSPHQPVLQSLGFDYTYDKQLYDRLTWGNLDHVRGWLTHHAPQFHKRSAHFIGNHDEPRAIEHFGSWWRSTAAALLTFTMPGIRFFWHGDWEGRAHKLDVHLRRAREEKPNKDVENFFEHLLPIINHDVFKKGEWTYVDVYGTDQSWRLIAYRWNYGTEKRLCVINFSDFKGSGRVVIDAEEKGGNDTIMITELLSGETYERSAREMREQGLFVIVDSWFAQIFSY